MEYRFINSPDDVVEVGSRVIVTIPNGYKLMGYVSSIAEGKVYVQVPTYYGTPSWVEVVWDADKLYKYM